MKYIKLILLVICILSLSACNSQKPKDNDIKVGTSIPSTNELPEKVEDEKIPKEESIPKEEIKPIEETKPKEENISIPQPNLSTDDEIRQYLIGEWIFDKEHISEVACQMNIDEYLNVLLSFENNNTGESKGSFSGYIEFDRQYANEDEAPDLMVIELTDTDYPGGVYFFLHRTIYDGKYVMSMFFAGNGNGIFDMLGDIDNFEYGPEEVIFEKTSGEKSQLSKLKDKEFYAVFWGKGAKADSLWLDEVRWTPIEEYDPEQMYPDKMILYENDVPESVLYNIRPDKIGDMEGTNIYPGVVYFIKTDKDGNILEYEDAEYKAYIEEINKP